MSGKSIQNRSSLSFCVPDGMIDMDHIMQLDPWREAEKFNTSEMNCIQNVLNEFNDMVLDRKHKDRKRRSVGKENVSASNNNASGKDEPRASKPASEKSGRKSMDRKKNDRRSENTDTTRVGEKPSKIPRPRQTIGEKKESGGKGEQRKQEDRPRNGKSVNKASRTSNNRTSSVRSGAKTDRKENIQADKLDAAKRTKKGEKKSSKQAQLAEGKGTGTGPSNFHQLPERKDSHEPGQISVKSEGGHPGNSSTGDKKRRRVQRRESLIVNKEKTVTVKQEQISMMEESNSDMTFDANALVNSTMSSHVPVSAMSSTKAVRNTASYSCVKKSTKSSKRIVETSAARAGTPQKLLQIKQEKESPITGKVEKTAKASDPPRKDTKIEVGGGKKCSKEPAKKSREDKPRAKAHALDRSKRRHSKEYTRRIRRHESGAKRAMEEFSHHVVSIAKEMGYLKDIDFSDDDDDDDDSLSDSDCSSCSSFSYSTHSEYCSCGECTSCSSDEYSEYTLCSCSGCSCCDSTSASDDSEEDR